MGIDTPRRGCARAVADGPLTPLEREGVRRSNGVRAGLCGVGPYMHPICSITALARILVTLKHLFSVTLAIL